MEEENKMNEKIHASMCRALDLLGADATLLSWACSRFDTQPDFAVLQGIDAWIEEMEMRANLARLKPNCDQPRITSINTTHMHETEQGAPQVDLLIRQIGGRIAFLEKKKSELSGQLKEVASELEKMSKALSALCPDPASPPTKEVCNRGDRDAMIRWVLEKSIGRGATEKEITDACEEAGYVLNVHTALYRGMKKSIYWRGKGFRGSPDYHYFLSKWVVDDAPLIQYLPPAKRG